MTTRRGFLGFLTAAPVAIPAAVKAAVAQAPKYASGGYVRGGVMPLVGETASAAIWPTPQTIIPFDSVLDGTITARSLTVDLKVDTSELDWVKQAFERHKMTIGGINDALAPGFIEHDGHILHDLVHREAPSIAPAERKGDWMQTANGRAFYPLDARPEEIHFDDIAAALSKLCRYGGHCHTFYSVAEHCVHIANAASDDCKLEALMHDASEAYLADIIRPIKPFLSNYLDIERNLEQTIANRFGLKWPMPPEVKRLDNAILADEMVQCMVTPPRDWRLVEPPIGVQIQFWTPVKAEYEFRAAFSRFGGHHC